MSSERAVNARAVGSSSGLQWSGLQVRVPRDLRLHLGRVLTDAKGLGPRVVAGSLVEAERLLTPLESWWRHRECRIMSELRCAPRNAARSKIAQNAKNRENLGRNLSKMLKAGCILGA